MKDFIGLPDYQSDYKTQILKRSLKSANDIPNPSGAAVGSLVVFDSDRGMKSNPSTNQGDWAGEYLNHRIYYDGPYSSKPNTAWSSKDTEKATELGITIAFEIERALFDGTNQSTWLPTGGASILSPLQLRGTSGSGYLFFTAGSVTGDTTYELTTGSEATGVNGTGVYLSKHANDKDFVPVVMSHRRGAWDLFLDGSHANHRVVTTADPAEFDDMYLGGKQYNHSGNVAPAGFPYYFRNLQILGSPVVLPIHPNWGRPVIMGDSVVVQGDYYLNSPRYDSGHAGAHCDAGSTPMIERLMHRDGIYTSDIHNSGRTGTRMLYVATATGLMDQVDGTNAGTEFDATEQNSVLGIIFCGLNDILNETSTIADIKTEARSVIRTMLDGNFEHIVLCNIYDARNAVGASNSEATIVSRTTDLNTAYAELASEFDRVYLCDVHSAFGSQNADYFRTDLYHPKEEGQALLGRTIYNTVSSNIF